MVRASLMAKISCRLHQIDQSVNRSRRETSRDNPQEIVRDRRSCAQIERPQARPPGGTRQFNNNCARRCRPERIVPMGCDIAVALRQIITRALRGLSADDRTRGSAGDRARNRAARPAGQETAKQPADDGAADRAGGRIRWRRGWRRSQAAARNPAVARNPEAVDNPRRPAVRPDQPRRP